MVNQVSRRHFLHSSLATALLATGAGVSKAEERQEAAEGSSTSPPFRFVHLTDIHVQPEQKADQGLAQCLKAVMQLDPRPDFILTGGDLVMDVLEQEEPRAAALFTLLSKVLKDNTDLPVHHCIGNHDVFAWGAKGISAEHPKYGKKMVVEQLGLPDRYYRFDHKGWRFYVLDDIQPAPNNSYQAYLDEPQMAWLEEELRTKPPEMPAAAVCHIPILTVTAFGDAEQDVYRVPTGAMCRDVHRLVGLFAKHNVRLALSGHLHQVDHIEFRGVTFICDGSVCGGWWSGQHKGFEEGFGVLDLKSDGSVEHQYFDYGWHA